MLGVGRCAARQGVPFEDMCSLRYAYQPHMKLCVYFMFSQGQAQVVYIYIYIYEELLDSREVISSARPVSSSYRIEC